MIENHNLFVGTEAEVNKVLKNEVIDGKRYEVKPFKFFKSWELKQRKEEESKQSAAFRFSPTMPEFHYKKSEDESRYLLILGKEGERKSGRLVKAFDSVEEAITIATRSIQKVSKELPGYAYFILDSERYGYVSEVNEKRVKRYEQFSGSR